MQKSCCHIHHTVNPFFTVSAKKHQPKIAFVIQTIFLFLPFPYPIRQTAFGPQIKKAL